MREILFRGKRIDNGEWVYGWYVGYSESMGYVYGDYIDKDEVWQVDASTVSQYTGLHDKNSKRIFEGDIVKCGTNKAGAVEYDPYEALYHVGNDPLQYYVYGSAEPETMRVEIEIIGNIHDKETSP